MDRQYNGQRDKIRSTKTLHINQ